MMNKTKTERTEFSYFQEHSDEYILADGYNQWGTFLDGELVDSSRVIAVQTVPGDIYSAVHMVHVGKKAVSKRLAAVNGTRY